MQLFLADCKSDFCSCASLLTQPQTVLAKLRLVTFTLRLQVQSHTSRFWTKRLTAFSSELTPCPLPMPLNILRALPPFSSPQVFPLTPQRRVSTVIRIISVETQETLLPGCSCRGHAASRQSWAEGREHAPGTGGVRCCTNTYELAGLRRKEWVRNDQYAIRIFQRLIKKPVHLVEPALGFTFSCTWNYWGCRTCN